MRLFNCCAARSLGLGKKCLYRGLAGIRMRHLHTGFLHSHPDDAPCSEVRLGSRYPEDFYRQLLAHVQQERQSGQSHSRGADIGNAGQRLRSVCTAKVDGNIDRQTFTRPSRPMDLR